jgi:acyl CoA:acetate/3-ketoacid CoA transferase beta subunit
MVSAAARELRDGEVVFVGIGLPNLACISPAGCTRRIWC